MGLKALIVAVWLTLPAAALLLLRGDYDRYQQEAEAQLVHARELNEHLVRFSRLYEQRREEVLEIRDVYSREQWEMRFNDVKRQQEQSTQKLGSSSLSHFVLSRDVLREAERLLDEQSAHVREAARLQDAYAKADNGLDDIESEVFRLRGWSDYYRRLGHWYGYLQVQEALGALEGQLRARSARRYELSSDITSTLTQAQGYERELSRALAQLPNQLERDRQRTYRENLQQRFAHFDLREQLRRLWASTALAEQ